MLGPQLIPSYVSEVKQTSRGRMDSSLPNPTRLLFIQLRPVCVNNYPGLTMPAEYSLISCLGPIPDLPCAGTSLLPTSDELCEGEVCG